LVPILGHKYSGLGNSMVFFVFLICFLLSSQSTLQLQSFYASSSRFLVFVFYLLPKLNLKVSCSLSSMYFGCVLVLFMALVCFCLLVLFVYYLLLLCCTILSFLRFSGFSNGSNVPNIGSTGNGEMECIGSTSISKVHTTYNKTNKKICKHKSCRNTSFVGKEWKILENSKVSLQLLGHFMNLLASLHQK